MPNKPSLPLDELPDLPPRGVRLEDSSVLKIALSTQRRLFQLKEATAGFGNDRMLLNNLLPVELCDDLSPDQRIDFLARFFSAEARRYERESVDIARAHRARVAVVAAYRGIGEAKEPLDAIRELGAHITGVARPWRDHGVRAKPQSAVQPPNWVRAKMDNLLDYMVVQDDTEPLVRTVVLFYQFQAIAPFVTENERAARFFLALSLVREQLLALPILHISRLLTLEREEYTRRLHAVGAHGDWTAFIAFVLDIIDRGAIETNRFIESHRVCLESISSVCRKLLPRVYTPELIQALCERPYCRITDLVELGIAKRQTASAYLHELAAMGILRIEKSGRDALFVNMHLLEYLGR